MENEGILYVFLVFQTEEVGQKDGGDSQTQLCGVALSLRDRFAAFQNEGKMKQEKASKTQHKEPKEITIPPVVKIQKGESLHGRSGQIEKISIVDRKRAVCI